LCVAAAVTLAKAKEGEVHLRVGNKSGLLKRFGMKSGVHFKIEWGAANKDEGASEGNGLRLMKLGGDDGGRPIEVAMVMSDSKKPGGGWVLQETFKLLRNSWEQTELATLQSEICQI